MEKVVDKKIVEGKVFYEIKWLGYDNPDDLTWEPIENCANCQIKIAEFEEGLKKRRSGRRPSARRSSGRGMSCK